MKNVMLLGILILINAYSFSQPISPLLPGQAYWGGTNANETPPLTAEDFSQETWNAVIESGVVLLRAGGKQYNVNNTRPQTPLQYVNLVDRIRSKGVEPMITMPYKYGISIEAQAEFAAEVIRIVNIVHKRNVKYVIIGNEPKQDNGLNETNAAEIANYIKAYAIAIKKTDPNILVIAPELNWARPELNDLCGTGNNSILTVIPATYNGQSTGSAKPKALSFGFFMTCFSSCNY
jgi:hypothetical protein